MARLLDAPAAMFYEQKDRADALQQQLDLLHPLEIIFDPTNPHNRFWERTSPRDENGKKLPGIVWEYRVKVQNNSSKTVRNVRNSRENSGSIPEMPTDLVFHKDGKQNRDLNPGVSEFVAVLWKFPPQAGDAWGETATAFHGQSKSSVAATIFCRANVSLAIILTKSLSSSSTIRHSVTFVRSSQLRQIGGDNHVTRGNNCSAPTEAAFARSCQFASSFR